MTPERHDSPEQDLGDEGLGRRYGPERLALWFDERKGHRQSNEPLWQVRRTLIRSNIWRGYEYTEGPLIPEWFGMLLPAERAYRESGHPVIWCIVFGFPRQEPREQADKLIEADRPPGLLKIDNTPPDPREYSLPLAGFLAKGAYLTLQTETRGTTTTGRDTRRLGWSATRTPVSWNWSMPTQRSACLCDDSR